VSDHDGTRDDDPRPLDRTSIAGLAASVALATTGLFALPPLRSLGLSFVEAFWATMAIEFVALVGVVASVLRLQTSRSSE
jgi:hypothetical protein